MSDLTTKICSKCALEKEIALFRPKMNKCKECLKEYRKNYENENRERIRERDRINSRAYYWKNRDSILAGLKTGEARAVKNKNAREWAAKNKTEIRRKERAWYALNRDRRIKAATERRHKDKPLYNLKTKLYREAHKEQCAEYTRKANLRAKDCPIKVLKTKVRLRIITALKRCGYAKNSYTRELLGIDYPRLKIYIERQFKKGMSWENNGIGEGKWHFDHKRPLSSAKTEEELLALFHYTNLQPLWAKDNISKGAKIIEHQLKLAI